MDRGLRADRAGLTLIPQCEELSRIALCVHTLSICWPKLRGPHTLNYEIPTS